MKGILEFDLDTPEGASDFARCNVACQVFSVLDEVRQLFRKYRKYEILNKTQTKFFNKLDEEFMSILNELPEVD